VLAFPDLIVEKTLSDGFAELKANPTPVSSILGTLSETEVADLQQYLVNTDIKVDFGYPRAPVSVPGVYITIADSPETDQFIGSDVPEDEEEEPLQTNTGNLVEGTRFSSSVRIACRAPNSKLVVYLAAMVQWLLIVNRMSMYDQGLQDQRISVRDVMPDSGLQPDLILQRDLMLSCSHFSSVITDVVDRVADVSVTVTPTTPVFEPPPVVIRNTARGN